MPSVFPDKRTLSPASVEAPASQLTSLLDAATASAGSHAALALYSSQVNA